MFPFTLPPTPPLASFSDLDGAPPTSTSSSAIAARKREREAGHAVDNNEAESADAFPASNAFSCMNLDNIINAGGRNDVTFFSTRLLLDHSSLVRLPRATTTSGTDAAEVQLLAPHTSLPGDNLFERIRQFAEEEAQQRSHDSTTSRRDAPTLRRAVQALQSPRYFDQFFQDPVRRELDPDRRVELALCQRTLRANGAVPFFHMHLAAVPTLAGSPTGSPFTKDRAGDRPHLSHAAPSASSLYTCHTCLTRGQQRRYLPLFQAADDRHMGYDKYPDRNEVKEVVREEQLDFFVKCGNEYYWAALQHFVAQAVAEAEAPSDEEAEMSHEEKRTEAGDDYAHLWNHDYMERQFCFPYYQRRRRRRMQDTQDWLDCLKLYTRALAGLIVAAPANTGLTSEALRTNSAAQDEEADKKMDADKASAEPEESRGSVENFNNSNRSDEGSEGDHTGSKRTQQSKKEKLHAQQQKNTDLAKRCWYNLTFAEYEDHFETEKPTVAASVLSAQPLLRLLTPSSDATETKTRPSLSCGRAAQPCGELPLRALQDLPPNATTEGIHKHEADNKEEQKIEATTTTTTTTTTTEPTPAEPSSFLFKACYHLFFSPLPSAAQLQAHARTFPVSTKSFAFYHQLNLKQLFHMIPFGKYMFIDAKRILGSAADARMRYHQQLQQKQQQQSTVLEADTEPALEKRTFLNKETILRARESKVKECLSSVALHVEAEALLKLLLAFMPSEPFFRLPVHVSSKPDGNGRHHLAVHIGNPLPAKTHGRSELLREACLTLLQQDAAAATTTAEADKAASWQPFGAPSHRCSAFVELRKHTDKAQQLKQQEWYMSKTERLFARQHHEHTQQQKKTEKLNKNKDNNNNTTKSTPAAAANAGHHKTENVNNRFVNLREAVQTGVAFFVHSKCHTADTDQSGEAPPNHTVHDPVFHLVKLEYLHNGMQPYNGPPAPAEEASQPAATRITPVTTTAPRTTAEPLLYQSLSVAEVAQLRLYFFCFPQCTVRVHRVCPYATRRARTVPTENKEAEKEEKEEEEGEPVYTVLATEVLDATTVHRFIERHTVAAVRTAVAPLWDALLDTLLAFLQHITFLTTTELRRTQQPQTPPHEEAEEEKVMHFHHVLHNFRDDWRTMDLYESSAPKERTGTSLTKQQMQELRQLQDQRQNRRRAVMSLQPVESLYPSYQFGFNPQTEIETGKFVAPPTALSELLLQAVARGDRLADSPLESTAGSRAAAVVAAMKANVGAVLTAHRQEQQQQQYTTTTAASFAAAAGGATATATAAAPPPPSSSSSPSRQDNKRRAKYCFPTYVSYVNNDQYLPPVAWGDPNRIPYTFPFRSMEDIAGERQS